MLCLIILFLNLISAKALEIFMQSLLETASKNTHARHAKTMSTAHLYDSTNFVGLYVHPETC